MKSFILACSFTVLFWGSDEQAYAGQQELPEPSLATMLGLTGRCAPNYITPNNVATLYAHQVIQGWSADGTQLYVTTGGEEPHGNCAGGRGISYWYWCGTLTWTITVDPTTGALNPIGTATYTPDATKCSTYGWWNNTGPVYNAFNYGAEIKVTQDPWSPTYYWDVATLLTP